MATEGAEDALLDDRLHVGDTIGRQVTGLVKHEVAVVGLAEHAVEDAAFPAVVESSQAASVPWRPLYRMIDAGSSPSAPGPAGSGPGSTGR